MCEDKSTFYQPVRVEREINLQGIHSLYYFELTHQDILEKEFHDFWELVYVDEGKVVVKNQENSYRLSQGELFIHEPNSLHSLQLLPDCQPNIFIASFSLENRRMESVRNKPFFTTKSQRRALSSMLMETQSLYGSYLGFHRNMTQDRLSSAKYASLQVIANHLELLLIDLIRTGIDYEEIDRKIQITTEEQREEILIKKAKAFMMENLDGKIQFKDICKHMGMSGTVLKILFRTNCGSGVMHCYQKLRIREACRMLRNGCYNVTQIAEKMGYPSCQAFSIHFSRMLGISPTKYLKRIKENQQCDEDL